jgi:hypothetical protein
MTQLFNYFDNAEIPALILCNPNKLQLYSLPSAYNIKNTLRYNAISEIEFDYPQYGGDKVTSQNLEATTNLFLNPSFEIDITGWTYFPGGGNTMAKDSAYSYTGSYSALCVEGGGSYFLAAANFILGETYTFSIYARRPDGGKILDTDIGVYCDNISVGIKSMFSVGNGWYRIIGNSMVALANEVGGAGLYLTSAYSLYIDGAQLEKKDHATPYCDGSLGAGYSWSGTEHYSTSSRIIIESSDNADPAYDRLKGKMLVFIEDVGYYIIDEAPEDLSGAVPVKHVKGMSLEAEMLSRRLTGFTGTYQFSTLLQTVLDLIPTWTINEIDDTLLPLYRTFTANNTTIYNFLVTDMEKAYGCIFEFNSITKTVSAVSNILPLPESDIYLSFDNLISDIEFREISEELCTCLHCYGGAGLDIHYVNPLGTDAIYDFSNFKTTEWMSQELIDSLTLWEAEVAFQQPVYANLLTSLETFYASRVILDSDMAMLLAQLETMADPSAERTAQLILINSKSVAISYNQSDINALTASLKKIVHGLYFTSKISYTVFQSDVVSMTTSIKEMGANWTEFYNPLSIPPTGTFDHGEIDNAMSAAFTGIEALHTCLETVLAIGGTGSWPGQGAIDSLTIYINQEITILNTLYALLQGVLSSTDVSISVDEIRTELAAYLDIICYSQNMTEAEYLELCSYIYENTYTNNNIIITDIMTPVDIQAQSQELYDQSMAVLDKASQPRYEISGDFSNFITLKEFLPFFGGTGGTYYGYLYFYLPEQSGLVAAIS